MFEIRQNATHKVVIGPAVAVGDGFTPVTNLAVSSADEAEVILHDNGTVVDISAYTWAAITTADGYYHLTLQSGISSTVGHMTVVINDDNLILPLRADFTVIEEAIYDAFYAASATGLLPADLTYIHGTALTETPGQIAASFVKLYDVANPTATCLSLPDAVPGAAGGVFIAGTNAETTVTTAMNVSIVGNITGDLSGSVESVTTKTGYSLADGSIIAATFAADAIAAGTFATGAFTADAFAANALIAATFAASSLDGKGDWNTVVPDVSGTAPTAEEILTAFGTGSTLTSCITATTLDAAGVRTAVGLTSANLDTQLADIPTVAEMNARTLVAANYFDFTTDTVIATLGAAAIRAAVGLAAANLDTQLGDIANVKSVTDKLDDALEDDAGTYRFTENALEEAPTGSGEGGGEGLDAAETRAAIGLASANLDTQLGDIQTTVDAISVVAGAGAVTCNVYTKDEDSTPLDGVEVWITTDVAGTIHAAGTLSSDALGLTTFYLDVGTYYLWRQLSGYNFTNPQTMVVS